MLAKQPHEKSANLQKLSKFAQVRNPRNSFLRKVLTASPPNDMAFFNRRANVLEQHTPPAIRELHPPQFSLQSS